MNIADNIGFDECRATNGVFTHRERDLRAVAHVDDFLLFREKQDLLWLRDRLNIYTNLRLKALDGSEEMPDN